MDKKIIFLLPLLIIAFYIVNNQIILSQTTAPLTDDQSDYFIESISFYKYG